MRFIFKIFIFLFFLSLSGCKVSAPCNQLDSSCNPVNALVLERLIFLSRIELNFSPPGAVYQLEAYVNISTSLASGVIRYTIDGTEPDCVNDIAYTGPVYLLGPQTYTLKAAVCVDGKAEKTKSDTYFIQ